MHWLYANGHLRHAPTYLSIKAFERPPAPATLQHMSCCPTIKERELCESTYTYQPVIFELIGMHHVVYVKAAMNGTLHSIQQNNIPIPKTSPLSMFYWFCSVKFQNIVRQMEFIQFITYESLIWTICHHSIRRGVSIAVHNYSSTLVLFTTLMNLGLTHIDDFA